MTTLYEMTAQMQGLRSMMEDDDVDFDLTDTLDALEGDIQVKAENLLAFVGNLSADVDQIDTAIKRLQDRKRRLVNHQDRLREYLRFNMQQADISKITCPLFTITLTKPRAMVLIDDADRIPDEYKKTTVTVSPVKADILKALKRGDDVPGASLGETQPGLMIK